MMKKKKEAILSTSRKMGYDFSYDEYLNANSEYFTGKSIWFGFEALAHIKNITDAVLKEQNK